MLTVVVKIESDNKETVTTEVEIKNTIVNKFFSPVAYLERHYKHEGYINPKITILETEDNE